MISFGPVPSRRLGKSLGINNIVSPKICSYGCIYCQVGNTFKKSIEREVFFKPENILEKIEQHIQKLNKDSLPDYLTFVSNGEPTLDINLGKSIKLLKGTGITVAVITNASLIDNESVREDLNLADWVSLKIDAGDKDTWKKVNQPFQNLKFENILNGIRIFSNEFSGILCTETMLIEGKNDSAENVSIISDFIKKLNPLKAYLSIPIRPPAHRSVKAPGAEIITRAWQIFIDKNINTELLTGFEGTGAGYTGNIYEDVLNITAVHPLREDSMMELLQNNNADFQVITSLINQRLIRGTSYNGHKYYLREYHHNF
ncbi:MAG TPA: radical SAM protein [Bacteroidales bacterium]|nr:radical SAM protein [Bacteroidales bacterium]